MPQHFDDVGECVETTLRRLGKRIVLALPLALGKPVPLANEFFHRASRDPSIDLRILTARPPVEEEARVPHRLFGHVDGPDAGYSAAR